MSTPDDHKFATFALVDCKRAKGGVAVYLDGGPLDGAEETIPLSASGVITSRDVPDGCGSVATVDYFYTRTTAFRGSRVVCRYNGRRRRA
jgi:hypothetical protein